ncbi:Sensory transduction protein LytR [subsurface metagenome]
MLRTVIIDDSPDSIDYLSDQLGKLYKKVRIIDTASSVEQGVALINRVKPDLVFLDIELGSQTGFDLLAKVNKISFNLIFTTGHNQYALDAFQYNAIHYLLKPVQFNELKDAVDRVREMPGKSDIYVSKIKSLLQDLNKAEPDKLSLCTEKGTRFVTIMDIILIQADGSYSRVKMLNGKEYILSRLLKKFEQELREYSFYRLSKSYLINLNHVIMYRRIDGGTVEMEGGINILVPRRKREDFMIKMTDFLR